MKRRDFLTALPAALAGGRASAKGFIVREIDSAAMLRDDVTMTYAVGPDQVMTGQYIATAREGFSYQLAASDASDHHLTTAGGIKLYVIPGAGNQDVRQWWVFPGNTPKQNDDGLVAMRNSLRAIDDLREWIVVFPPGLYQYNNNRWVRMRKLEILGYGAKFQCLAASETHEYRRCFNHSTPFQRQGDDTKPLVTYLGRLIETVPQGSKTVTLKTVSEATQFAIGNRVLIASRDVQFGGFPPNYGQFQFTKVAAIDIGTGVITLCNPTLCEYREDDTHQVSGDYATVGRAAMYNLDRGYMDYVHPERFILRGATLVKNPAFTSGQGEVLTGDYGLWEDVQLEFDGAGAGFYLWPSIGDILEMKRLRATGKKGLNADFDKIVNRFLLEDTVMGGTAIAAATGIKHVLFNRVRFDTRPNISPNQVVRYRNCEFAFAPPDQFGMIQRSIHFGTGMVELEGNNFRFPADFGSLHIVNDLATVSDTPVSVPSANVLYFDATTTAGRNIAGSARRGRLLWSSDGFDVGTVKSVTHDTTGFRVEVIWTRSKTPSGSKVYFFQSGAGAIDLGGNTMTAFKPMFRNDSMYSSVGAFRHRRGLLRQGAEMDLGTTDGVTLFQNAPRYIGRLSINVLRACSGPNSKASLSLTFTQVLSGRSLPNRSVTVNLKEEGLRVFTPVDHGTEGPGDRSTLADEIYFGAHGIPRGDERALRHYYTDSDNERPLVEIELEYRIPGAL